MNWLGLHTFTSAISGLAKYITGTAGAGFIQIPNQTPDPGNADASTKRLYTDASNILTTIDSVGTKAVVKLGGATVIQSVTSSGASVLAKWVADLTGLHVKNVNAKHAVASYIHGATAVANAYDGAVYSPTQNRIYLLPRTQSTATQWHYIDGVTGAVVPYTTSATAVGLAYAGGSYSPTQNRIYLAPSSQATATQWHYIDCSSGAVVAYSTGVVVSSLAYTGSCYSPTQNRIYLAPLGRSSSATWHYIDCSSGAVTVYTHGFGLGIPAFAYAGAAYSPTQNRIYFAPYSQSAVATWHYVDCTNGSIIAYTHGFGTAVGSYQGACYSPTQNRIYFAPLAQSNVATWHYIDCSNGSVIAYTHGFGTGIITNAYNRACYSPTQNRIYLVPNAISNVAVWHYIDCSNGSVIAYTHGFGTSITTAGYSGAAYDPTLNRIYLAPYGQAAQTTWHYISSTGSAETLAPYMFGGSILSSAI